MTSSETIVVYTKPACMQCTATFRYLDKAGLGYRKVDVSTNPEAKDFIDSLGYQSLPVVVAGEQHWSGFRVERIRALGSELT